MRTINRSTSFKRDYKRIKASPQHKKDIDSLIEAALVLLLTDQTARANDLAKVKRANRNLSSKQNEALH
jgi:mRNA-degrading endonuclease YafQ of YafQ-DinJ toxin-antitoxin module